MVGAISFCGGRLPQPAAMNETSSAPNTPGSQAACHLRAMHEG
jgi:hypothetical protein